MPDKSVFIHLDDASNSRQGRKRKIDIPVGMIFAFVGLILILLSAITYGLWILTVDVSRQYLRIFLMILMYALPITFAFGYWFGSKEVRGFLSGADAVMDKIAKAVDIRDSTKVTVHQKLQTPKQPAQHNEVYPTTGINIRKPDHLQLPQLTFRESGKDQIIDL